MNIEVNRIDLEDYAVIRAYVPEANQKQVRWIKATLDDLRLLGAQEPVGSKFLKDVFESMDPPFRMQFLAACRRTASKLLKERKAKMTAFERTGQFELFHPEAFDGGDSTTLRNM